MYNYKVKYILIFVETGYNTMLYIIFQYGWQPVLIQRILIGLEWIQARILQSLVVLYSSLTHVLCFEIWGKVANFVFLKYVNVCKYFVVIWHLKYF